MKHKTRNEYQKIADESESRNAPLFSGARKDISYIRIDYVYNGEPRSHMCESAHELAMYIDIAMSNKSEFKLTHVKAFFNFSSAHDITQLVPYKRLYPKS